MKSCFSSYSRRAILLFVLILSQFAPGLEAKERKGAQVMVKKLDGTIFNGELLDVQGDKLTVLDRSASAEVTASFLEIKEIDIAKKSARKNALVMGALAGAVIGGLCFASGEPDPNDDFRLTPASGAVAGALGGAFWASLIVGVSEQIDLENKTPEKIAKISVRLQKYSKKGRNNGGALANASHR
jgi:outer membrane lipoprotein SlyB